MRWPFKKKKFTHTELTDAALYELSYHFDQMLEHVAHRCDGESYANVTRTMPLETLRALKPEIAFNTALWLHCEGNRLRNIIKKLQTQLYEQNL